jgi:hypothetical protein
MRLLILLALVSVCYVSRLEAQSGGDVLKGCRKLLEIEAHDCKDANCAHFKKNEVLQAIGSYQYFSGFVLGVRTSQAIGQGPRVVDFPEDGFDPHTLITPLIAYLESAPKVQTQHASVGIYAFLLKTYPSKKK